MTPVAGTSQPLHLAVDADWLDVPTLAWTHALTQCDAADSRSEHDGKMLARYEDGPECLPYPQNHDTTVLGFAYEADAPDQDPERIPYKDRTFTAVNLNANTDHHWQRLIDSYIGIDAQGELKVWPRPEWLKSTLSACIDELIPREHQAKLRDADGRFWACRDIYGGNTRRADWNDSDGSVYTTVPCVCTALAASKSLYYDLSGLLDNDDLVAIKRALSGGKAEGLAQSLIARRAESRFFDLLARLGETRAGGNPLPPDSLYSVWELARIVDDPELWNKTQLVVSSLAIDGESDGSPYRVVPLSEAQEEALKRVATFALATSHER